MTRRADIERLARFMGWELRKEKERGEYWWHPYTPMSSYSEKPNFDPFTRLDDAMAVAEKIASERFQFELHNDGRVYQAIFRDVESSEPPIWFAETIAPPAIANAALAYLSATEGK